MTDQPKWTKGPWRADGDTYNRVVWSDADNRVCFMAHSNGLDDIRDIATSNLIAAAPDMATVLEYYADQFCEGFCKDLPQAGTYQPEMDLDCSGCKARAALAKARGETK